MVANKRTRKNVINLCDDVINLLSDLNIEDKNNKKKVDKIIKEANICKELFDETNNKTHNSTGYNRFIKDCYNIKKGNESSGLLGKNIEKEILNNIENNKDKHIFTIFGNTWKTLDKNIKNKYNIDKDKKVSKRGRPHKDKKKDIINND